MVVYHTTCKECSYYGKTLIIDNDVGSGTHIDQAFNWRGIRILQKTTGIQQHRGRGQYVPNLDRRVEEAAWDGQNHARLGTDRPLLVFNLEKFL